MSPNYDTTLCDCLELSTCTEFLHGLEDTDFHNYLAEEQVAERLQISRLWAIIFLVRPDNFFNNLCGSILVASRYI